MAIESVKAYEWSLTITDTQMHPKYTDLGYVPDELLSQLQIRCKCKTNCLTKLFGTMPLVNAVARSVKTQSIQTLRTALYDSM